MKTHASREIGALERRISELELHARTLTEAASRLESLVGEVVIELTGGFDEADPDTQLLLLPRRLSLQAEGLSAS